MNKIVREHFAVSQLPEDLQRELGATTSVRLTVEPADPPAGLRMRSVLERARKLREEGIIRPVTAREAVERVRRLRDD